MLSSDIGNDTLQQQDACIYNYTAMWGREHKISSSTTSKRYLSLDDTVQNEPRFFLMREGRWLDSISNNKHSSTRLFKPNNSRIATRLQRFFSRLLSTKSARRLLNAAWRQLRDLLDRIKSFCRQTRVEASTRGSAQDLSQFLRSPHSPGYYCWCH